MKKTSIYKYIGYNGTIISSVKLNCSEKLVLVQLQADKDKMLTDGNVIVNSITVPEDEVSNWTEVDNIGQD